MILKVVSGTVKKGNERGRMLGYPTANIPLEDEKLTGVYAGMVRFDDQERKAAIFIDQNRKLVESYVLDYEGDLYDKHLTVELYSKIRDSHSFHSDDSLKAAIREDVQKVRAYFE